MENTDMKSLEAKLAEVASQMKTYYEKSTEELKNNGAVLATTVAELKALQTQYDALDLKMTQRIANSGEAQKSLVDHLKENEDISRIVRDKKGHAIINLTGKQVSDLMERKDTVTLGGLGAGTAGVVEIERMPAIVPEARRKLTIRDLLSSRVTSAGLIYYVKVTQPPNIASPVAETMLKPEAKIGFATATAAVKTIASWIPASKQALDDFSELEGFLRSAMPYYVNREEEHQLLSGDNTGENLNGLITQAAAFNGSLLGGSYTRIDQIGAAIEQIEISDEIEPSFVALNPRDWWDIRRTKDTLGRYILGDPQTAGNPTIWDLVTVPTNGVVAGTFLVGSGQSAAAEIRDRMEMQIEISTEHADYFTKNLVAIRAEKRLALVVLRPASFISGTFASSPA